MARRGRICNGFDVLTLLAVLFLVGLVVMLFTGFQETRNGPRKVWTVVNLPRFLDPQDALIDAKTMSAVRRMARVRQGCAEICDDTIPGTPSLFFNYIEKKVDCPALWKNEAIDEAMVETSA